MATSIKINSVDANATYGVTILGMFNMGTPQPLSNDSSSINDYQPKAIRFRGEIVATTHATLLSYIDEFKKATAFGFNGLRKFRLELTDYSNRYWMAWCAWIDLAITHPTYLKQYAEFELVFIIDEPVAIYDTLSLPLLTGSPFSSPFSIGYTHSGTAVARPRIHCYNAGAGAITSLEIINLAVRQKEKAVSVTTTGLKWDLDGAVGYGRWSDAFGRVYFDGAGSSYFTTKGNFNPAAFTVSGWVKHIVGAENSPGYFFSTTGDNVRCYYDLPNTKWVFEVDGDTVEITDATSGFVHSEWWFISCSYDGDKISLDLYDLGGTTSYNANASGTTYRTIPTNTYIGTDASLANYGDKLLDDVRFHCRELSTVELTALQEATGPLPMGDGCTAYFPFDYEANGKGWENTSLVFAADTMSQYERYEIDCFQMKVYNMAVAVVASATNAISKVSGEFPVLVPGVNGLQFIHDGSASGLSVAIEDKRDFI